MTEEKRIKLMLLAKAHGLRRLPVAPSWFDCHEDDLIALLQAVEKATLERAAVECERSEMYRGSIFAARIRKLKEPQ